MERELLETGHAMTQTISRLQREVATLRRRSGWTGSAIRGELTEDLVTLTDQTDITLVEFDVAPGRWYVSYRVAMRVMASGTSGPEYTGFEEATMRLSIRSIGATLASAIVVDEIQSGAHGAPQTALGAGGRAEYPLVGFETVSSEEGLTLRLYGAARDWSNNVHPATWHQAKMIATPL